MLADAAAIGIIPTNAKRVPLSRLWAAVQEVATNDVASITRIAAHQHLSEAQVQTVLAPALRALVEKGFIEFESGDSVRLL